MPICTPHYIYQESMEWRQDVEDAIAGEPRIKSKDERYLPWVGKPKSTPNAEQTKRYESYKRRAEFDNTVEPTRSANAGVILGKEPSIGLPDSLKYLETNIDGSGNRNINDFAKASINGISTDNSVILLSDTTKDESGRDIAIVRKYWATDVINWDWDERGQKFNFVIIKQVRLNYDNDCYTPTERTDYLELRLDEEGYYFQQLHSDVGDGGYEPTDEVYMEQYGQRMTRIPISFSTDETNNEPSSNTSMLYPIARKAIALYQSNADLKKAMYLFAAPTSIISGVSRSWLEQMREIGIDADTWSVGSDASWMLDKDMSAQLMQMDGDGSVFFKYRELNLDMQERLGSRAMNQSSTGTATEALIRSAAENASLMNIANNFSESMTYCLRECAKFMGIDESKIAGIYYRINTEFVTPTLTAQEATEVRNQVADSIITREMGIQKLIDGGWLKTDSTAEEIDTLLKNQDPLVGATASAISNQLSG